MLLPHWGGLARFAAGGCASASAAWQEGLALSRSCWCRSCSRWLDRVAVSAVLARAGVARPDRDVVQFVVRWGGREHELQPITIGAAVIQFGLSIMTLPAVKLLPPSVLYQPELGPSRNALLVALAVSIALLVLVYVLWAGRIQLHAPAEQQREAEEGA